MANITGTEGPDALAGTESADNINGLGGDDVIDGSGGNDTIFAGSGADAVIGGTGNDGLFGEGDDDLLLGDIGEDLVDGGSGDDIVADNDIFVVGGVAFASPDASRDDLRGGVGDDFLVGGLRDVFDGGAGFDLALISFEAESNLTVDLRPLNSGGTATLPLGGSIRNVEGGISITFGGGANVAFGSDFFEELFGGSGADTFDGAGGDDDLRGAGGNDVLRGGPGDDSIDGGADIDTASYDQAPSGVTVALNVGVQNTGGAGVDALFDIENLVGSAFNDVLIGSGLFNTITGGAGDDFIDGVTGNDTMIGGLGNDTYVVNNSLTDVVIEQAGSGTDTIRSAHAVFSLAGYAHVENLTYNDIGGSIDATGNALGNVMTGGAGDDALNGAEGADTLMGAGGADELNGGLGTDTADYSASAAGVTVRLENGVGENGDAQGDTLTSIENVTGSGSADSITGAEFIANRLEGGGGDDVLIGLSGNDALFGGAGVDQLDGGADGDALSGGAGADVLNGGSGVDTANYASSLAGVTVRLWNGTGQNGDAQGDTLTSFENVTGSGAADSLIGADAMPNGLTGGDGDDFLAGLSGNDVLSGGAGADRLEGGADNDSLTGGVGADVLSGGAGTDTATYATSAAGVTVRLWSGAGQNGDAQGDALTSIENVTGSGLADSLIGADAIANFLAAGGGNDFLAGLSGNDVLQGGAGADTLDGGAGTDTADYATSSAGVTVRLWNGTGQNGDAQGDTLTSIEDVTGSSLVDNLIGADAIANVLSGGGAADFLAGLSGDDVLDGGDHGDVLRGGAGADTLDGGAGTDTADYTTSTAGVTVRLGNGTGQNGDAEGDALTGIENVTGSNLGDELIGAEAIANFLAGGGGNDFVFGLSGDDVLQGGAGADMLDGGAGTDTADYATSSAGVTVRLWNGTGQNGDAQGDTLTGVENVRGSGLADSLIGADAVANFLGGGGGNDFLAGLSGNDVLEGGAGADQLAGGVGDDTFVFRRFDGSDIVTDFAAGAASGDVIQLAGWGASFDTFGEVTAAASQVGAHVVIDFGAGQTLTLQNVTLANLDAGDFLFG